jgi:glycosyltransferase involved in cell wall biosynthesis
LVKLVILIPDLGAGGAERVALTLAQYFPDDLSTRFVLFENNRDFETPTCPVHVVSTANGLWNRLVWPFDAVASVRQLKEIYRPTVSLSFTVSANLVNAATASAGGATVVSIRNTMSKALCGKSRPLFRALIHRLYRNADRIITLSESVRRDAIDYLRLPPERIVTIYNPLDVERIERESAEPIPELFDDVFGRGPVLVTVGRLAQEKGHSRLIRVFASVNRKLPDSRLMILGAGSLHDSLVALARSLGLKTFSALERTHPDGPAGSCSMVFAGFQPRPAAFVSRATLFVFPSLWEGLGQALVESLACGVCIVAADCRSGPRELLAPDHDRSEPTKVVEQARYGFLLPPFERNELSAAASTTELEHLWAEVLSSLLADSALRESFRRRTRSRAMDFHVKEIAAQWLKQLSDVA